MMWRTCAHSFIIVTLAVSEELLFFGQIYSFQHHLAANLTLMFIEGRDSWYALKAHALIYLFIILNYNIEREISSNLIFNSL